MALPLLSIMPLCAFLLSAVKVVQALRELQKFEAALNGAFLLDSAGRQVGNHKVHPIPTSGCDVLLFGW